MPVQPGYRVWGTFTPLTLAASPLTSQWIDTTGFTIFLPWFSFAGGTSTFTVEGGTDGTNADADFAYAGLVSGTAVTVISPLIRFRVVQTVADATKTKIFIQARA
jgi:hypothetical protein